jgi:BlaI family penicillinase repressor
MKKHPKISESEWEVMNVIWAGESHLSTSQIIERLPTHKEWKLTTVKTFLDRLVEKGVLGYEIHAGRYFYRAKISKEECVKEESQSFLDRIFSGQKAPMLVQFVKSTKLSREEIHELKEILNKKEKGENS